MKWNWETKKERSNLVRQHQRAGLSPEPFAPCWEEERRKKIDGGSKSTVYMYSESQKTRKNEQSWPTANDK